MWVTRANVPPRRLEESWPGSQSTSREDREQLQGVRRVAQRATGGVGLGRGMKDKCHHLVIPNSGT